YIVHFAAGVMAERLVNTLVAPVIQYVPQGNYNSQNFASRSGAISNPAPSYNLPLDAAVRRLLLHGFTDIILIGDGGGNQSGMAAVADSINRDWSGSGYRVFALTDYYSKGRADLRAWLQSTYGYAEGEIGTHAGITDTSQLMYIFPQGIRTD